MTRQLFGSPYNNGSSGIGHRGGIHKAPHHQSSTRASRRSSTGSSQSIDSASSSSLSDYESQIVASTLTTTLSNTSSTPPGSIDKFTNDSEFTIAAPSSSESGQLPPNNLAKTADIATFGANESEDINGIFEINDEDQKEVPAVLITRSHRRSSSLSECMMKEKMTWRAMGRDEEGYPRYAFHIEESQGFRWNRYLHRVGHSFGGLEGNSFFEDLSSEEEFESDISDES